VAVKPGRAAQDAPDVLENANGDALSDMALVARMASGDAEAFALLVTRHVGTVSAVARRMLGDDSEAEDVTQEAFLKLWRLGAGLTIDTSGVRPWLRRVVSNLAIDRMRARRRTDVMDELPEIPVAAEQLRALEGIAVAERVDQALQALPERQRLALTLFHFEGMSQREVASSMEISDEAVDSLLARARRGLKSALANEWRELMAGSEAD
jgi:RNA polymerase sigma-70 factor (ECF subfamily)